MSLSGEWDQLGLWPKVRYWAIRIMFNRFFHHCQDPMHSECFQTLKACQFSCYSFYRVSPFNVDTCAFTTLLGMLLYNIRMDSLNNQVHLLIPDIGQCFQAKPTWYFCSRFKIDFTYKYHICRIYDRWSLPETMLQPLWPTQDG